MKAIFKRKDEHIEESTEFRIIKSVELTQEKFEQFSQNLLDDCDFIIEEKDRCFIGEDGIANCILVLCEGQDDGILINSEGYDYARYTSFLPNARQTYMVQKYPSLNRYALDMVETVDHYVEQVLEFQNEGECEINYYNIKSYLGHDYLDEVLMLDMMNERKEIESVDNTAEGYSVYVAQEYKLPEEELKELDKSDIEIMCAKHILWQRDAGGEQAIFSNCLIKDEDISNMNFVGAIFDNARLVNVNMENCELTFSTFNNAKIYNCNMNGIMAEESEFNDAIIYNCELKEATFACTDFTNAKVVNCSVNNTNMQKCCIENTNFDDTEKCEIDLQDSVANQTEWGKTAHGVSIKEV